MCSNINTNGIYRNLNIQMRINYQRLKLIINK
jgi:hypothetical protein